MTSISGTEADETSLQRLIDQHSGTKSDSVPGQVHDINSEEDLKSSGPKSDFAPGQVHAVRSKKDLENLQATGKLVVTDWYAQWCGPCKIFKPTFQKMAEEQTDVLFCKIDVDENKELAAQYAIRSMPTFKASVRAITRIVKTNVFSCCEAVP